MAVDAMNERFEEVEFQGKTVLFTDCRVQKDTIPEGLHRYEIRHTDDDWGEPCQLGYGIVVNHFGTLISNEAIQLDPSGHLDFDADDMNFLGNGYVSIGEYLEEHPPVDKTVFEILPIDADKTDWLYSDDSKDAERGLVGHLRGDFGGGKEFWTTWWPHNDDKLNTQSFKTELDAVVNWLRQDFGPLNNLRSMEGFCKLREDRAKVQASLPAYGFQIEMPEHQYFLRCNPSCGDYNFYLYCADKEAQRLFERDRDKVSEKKLSIIQKLRDTSKQEAKITAPKKSAEMEI
ncbi:MAG TPA: hypothetical protein PK629_01880 [Oscillospiraceae bacterium]|jgi:hypothetical protein|nr:hypothetical protein [Oscillospiraceae bacterium]HPF54629.1 hypothetical protein [Clostridia bacterium]HPK35211.1 hypothetical protein [Oscillospiraceae bacterium]